jgi:23S rRNA pseudouridine1911/1915/1917 synthase
MNFVPEIVFEDKDLLVLNKPAGLIVNRADSVKESTLQDWVEKYLIENLAGEAKVQWEADRQADEGFRERSGMVHRLDKDTSGIIVFAKRRVAMYAMMEQFQARKVQKTYLALVHEHFADKQGIISTGIARHPRDRERFSVTSEGRVSETWYKVEREYAGIDVARLLEFVRGSGLNAKGVGNWIRVYQGFSLVSLQPKTGRTHQLRVHLKFLHHPIVGDGRYVGNKRFRVDNLWCPRQWLHAWKIEFTHPVSEQVCRFEAPLAEDLEKTFEFLVS